MRSTFTPLEHVKNWTEFPQTEQTSIIIGVCSINFDFSIRFPRKRRILQQF